MTDSGNSRFRETTRGRSDGTMEASPIVGLPDVVAQPEHSVTEHEAIIFSPVDAAQLVPETKTDLEIPLASESQTTNLTAHFEEILAPSPTQTPTEAASLMEFAPANPSSEIPFPSLADTAEIALPPTQPHSLERMDVEGTSVVTDHAPLVEEESAPKGALVDYPLPPGEKMDEEDESSTSSSEDEEEEHNLVEMGGDDYDEDDEGAYVFKPADIPKSKHEISLLEVPASKEDITIDPQLQLHPAGVIDNIVEGFVVIKAIPGQSPLNIDSVLCFEDRLPLGRIFEVFGPVPSPFYSVHYESIPSVTDKSLVVRGKQVFSVVPMSSFVFMAQIYTKGSDASGDNDEEPPADQLEFSDDEAEQAAKKLTRRKKQHAHTPHTQQQPQQQTQQESTTATTTTTHNNPHGRGRGRGRGGRGRGRGGGQGRGRGHPSSAAPFMSFPSYSAAGGQGEVCGEGYTPLTRPDTFLSQQLPPPQHHQPQHYPHHPQQPQQQQHYPPPHQDYYQPQYPQHPQHYPHPQQPQYTPQPYFPTLPPAYTTALAGYYNSLPQPPQQPQQPQQLPQ